MFSESFPQFKIKLTETINQFVKWYAHEFNYSRWKVDKWISDTQSDAISNYAYGETFTQLGKMGVALVLIPVYLFMILYYKSLLLEFIRKLFRLEHHTAVVAVLANSKNIIQSYLVGLFFEMLIMAVLNSTAFLLLGIDYAIILGILAAVLNIIPYIGGVVATLLPMAIAFVTKDSLTLSRTCFCNHNIYPVHRQQLYSSEDSCIPGTDKCIDISDWRVDWWGFMGCFRHVSFYSFNCHPESYF